MGGRSVQNVNFGHVRQNTRGLLGALAGGISAVLDDADARDLCGLPSLTAGVVGAVMQATDLEGTIEWSPTASALLPDVLPVPGAVMYYNGARQLGSGGAASHAGSLTLGGALTLAGAPTLLLHAATKGYVDSAVGAVDLSSRVPYTGATGAVNLGSQNLSAGAMVVDNSNSSNVGVDVRPWVQVKSNLGALTGYLGSGASVFTSVANGATDLGLRAVGALGLSAGNSVTPHLSIAASGAITASGTILADNGTIQFDDANGFISRTAASNTMHFGASSGTTTMALSGPGGLQLGTSAGYGTTDGVPCLLRSINRGGNSGVGLSTTVRGGDGSTVTTVSPGGNVIIFGGSGAANNNNGGNVLIDGGSPHGTGANGQLLIGSTRTTNVSVTGAITASTTVTTSSPVLNLSQTWNGAGQTFVGMSLDVTKTAAALSSPLMRIRQGGLTAFQVDADSFRIACGGVQVTDQGYNLYSFNTNNALSFRADNSGTAIIGNGVNFSSNRGLRWSSTVNWFDTIDVGITRGSAGVLEINNGTLGTLRDFRARDITASGKLCASNPANTLEQLSLRWASNEALIGVEYTGTNNYRAVKIVAPNLAALSNYIGISENNGIDINWGAASRIRCLNVGTTISGGTTTISTPISLPDAAFLTCGSTFGNISLGNLSGTGMQVWHNNVNVYGSLQWQPRQSTLDPTTTDIPPGRRVSWYNSTVGEFRDWVNIGGVLLKSAAYT